MLALGVSDGSACSTNAPAQLCICKFVRYIYLQLSQMHPRACQAAYSVLWRGGDSIEQSLGLHGCSQLLVKFVETKKAFCWSTDGAHTARG